MDLPGGVQLFDIFFFNEQACFPIQGGFSNSRGVETDGRNTQGVCFDEDGGLTLCISVAGCHAGHAENPSTI